MTPKRVLLRERDFHNARIAILRELTGDVAESPGLEHDAAADQCNVKPATQRVDAVKVLSLALTG